MQRNHRKQLVTAIATLLLTTPLWATNGYYTHGTGTKNKGMAGAGLAHQEDAIAVANNPAAALAAAGSYDLGIAVFSPRRSYETSSSLTNGQGGAFTIGPNDLKSTNDYFYIPHMAGSWKINDQSAFAVAFYGRGGMNTTWRWGTAIFDPDGPGPAPVTRFTGTYGGSLAGGNGTAGVDLSQAFLNLTYAHALGDSFTLGVSAVGVMQLFSARGLAAFSAYTETFAASGGTVFPSNLTNNGHDTSYGLGVQVGLDWDIGDSFSLAASYSPKIKMSKLKDYSDLFADGGNMDIPADLKVGLTFYAGDSLSFSLDLEKIWYNDVTSVGNPFANLYSCPTAGAGGTDLTACLGGKNGAGFGWDDMTIYKGGFEWAAGNGWTWRAGYSYGEQPISSSEVVFNILAPGVMEDHFTAGFTKKVASGDEFNVAFMYAPKVTVSGPNMLDYPDPFLAQTITLEMSQYELEFSYSWK